MQKCSPACKLLLITPALFILLQVAMTLHHHHNNSYHDSHDYFHAVSTSVDKHFSAMADFITPLSRKWFYNYLATASNLSFHPSHKTDLFISPSKSRAPPKTINV